jgi:amino-acid N-acetyltransferase
MSSIAIGPATPTDVPAILGLLERCDLPTVGLAEHITDTLVARMADRVVGSVALEVYADGALLRSVAVDQSVRGTGIGVRLTEAALNRARNRGIAAVYLLTTTAQHFFPKFGFEEITRDKVPPTIHASVEFESACPATATVMRKRL